MPIEVFPCPADADRYPVEIGFPFPAGALNDPAAIRLLDSGGQEVPLQVAPLSRYADGSLRAVLLIFLSPVSKEKSLTYTVEFGPTVARRAAPASAVKVSEKDGLATVDSGPLRFQVGQARPLISSVRAGDKEVLLKGLGGFIQEAGRNEPIFGKNWEAQVEESGPIRGVILVNGRFGEAADAHGYQARIHAYAGTGLVRVQYTVIGLDGKKPLELAGWGIGLPELAAGPRKAACGLDGSAKELDLARGEGLFQDGVFGYGPGSLSEEDCQKKLKSNTPFKPGELPGWRYKLLATVGQNQAVEGRADGWLSAELGGSSVAVCVRDFWQQFPKEWAGGEKGVTVWLHSPRGGPFLAKAGTAKTHELLFDFSSDGRAAKSAAALNAVFQDWPVARVSPEWVCATGVFGPLLPRSDPFAEQYNAMADVYLGFIRHTDGRFPITATACWYMYGNADFGDVAKSVAPYNVPVAHTEPFTLEFLRGGDREWARLAARAVRHHGDIDINHVRAAAGDIGQPWAVNAPVVGLRTSWPFVGGFFSQDVFRARDRQQLADRIKESEAKFAAVEAPRGMHQYRASDGTNHESHMDGAWPHYLLSGDRRVGQVIREQGEWLLQATQTARKSAGGGRGSIGFRLGGLLDACQATDDARFLRGAGAVIEELLAWWKTPLADRRERDVITLRAKLAATRPDAQRLELPTHGFWDLQAEAGRGLVAYIRRLAMVARFLKLDAPESATGVDNEQVKRMFAECMETLVNNTVPHCTPGYIYPWTAAANLDLWPEQTRARFEQKVLMIVAVGRLPDLGLTGTGSATTPPPVLRYRIPFLYCTWKKTAGFTPINPDQIVQAVISPSAVGASTCHLHEMGIEHAMVSYPHFVAEWKTYHEKHLKPRMNADGVLEFSLAPGPSASQPAR